MKFYNSNCCVIYALSYILQNALNITNQDQDRKRYFLFSHFLLNLYIKIHQLYSRFHNDTSTFYTYLLVLGFLLVSLHMVLYWSHILALANSKQQHLTLWQYMYIFTPHFIFLSPPKAFLTRLHFLNSWFNMHNIYLYDNPYQ